MLKRINTSRRTMMVLCVSLLMSLTSYGQLSDIEFIDFDMSDTVVIGGTLTITGVLKNNGTDYIPAELALRMATGTIDNPPEPYSDNFFENNFNNGIIYPGETQSFVRLIEVTEEWFDLANINLQHNEENTVVKSAAAGGRVIAVIWPRGGGPQLEHQENSPQHKSNMDSLDMYMDSIVVLQPEQKVVQESYNANPGILQGASFLDTPLEGVMPEDIVGFRYEDNEWIQIPVQIDEMKWVNPYTLYNLDEQVYQGNPIKVYADPGTYTGADDNVAFDDDDELVFMLKDAGSPINLQNSELPEGVIPGTGVEISIQNARLQRDNYIYLFNQDGSLEQDADSSYISYDLSINSPGLFIPFNYFDHYNMNNPNPENTSVVGDNYILNFSDTWKMEDMHIIEEESSGIDIISGIFTYFEEYITEQFDYTFRCFVVNKEGPIRAIRSYMRGDGFEPLNIQKTHFFYGNRHDVFTNLRGGNSSSLFDFLNIEVSQQYMDYQSNIDVTPMLLDNIEDPLCSTLYDNTPMKWELAQGEQGSLGIVHEVLVNGMPDHNSNLLRGYWSDGGIIYNEQNIDAGNGQYVILKSNTDSGVGMWADISSDDNSHTDIEFRRYTYVDEPGMSVEAMTANSNSVRQPPAIEVNPDKYYELRISAYLEGALQYPDLKMDNSLNVIHGLLPGQDSVSNASDSIIIPYSVAPWNYPGTECDTFANMQYPENAVDWVLVSFRTGVDSDTEVAKTMGLLTQDGTIEFLNECTLGREDGSSFYIVVEHRNHIGIMSPTPISVVDAKLEYDFRTQDSFTNNGTRSGQKEVISGTWAMFAGEGVQDINGNDINGQDKGFWAVENGTFRIYSPTDFNMDGSIDGQDKGLWFSNNGISGALMR